MELSPVVRRGGDRAEMPLGGNQGFAIFSRFYFCVLFPLEHNLPRVSCMEEILYRASAVELEFVKNGKVNRFAPQLILRLRTPIFNRLVQRSRASRREIKTNFSEESQI